MNTPILLIIFNRPEVTKKLVAALSKVKPSNIFVVADGPRKDRPGEEKLYAETRVVIETINWPCTIQKKYSDINQGCDPTIEAGVSWFFNKVEAGIILEDDCIPDPTFFDFAIVMLDKYKDDEKIMHINGSNFQYGKTWGNGSYYFSSYPHSWGWATWKRAWKNYDHNLSSFPEFNKNKIIDNILTKKTEKKFWLGFFQKIYNGKFPFWDSRWTYNIWSHGGICITPNQNLVNYLGYGNDATNTFYFEKTRIREVNPLFELVHPHSEEVIKEADQKTFWNYYYRSFWQKLYYKIHSLLK